MIFLWVWPKTGMSMLLTQCHAANPFWVYGNLHANSEWGQCFSLTQQYFFTIFPKLLKEWMFFSTDKSFRETLSLFWISQLHAVICFPGGDDVVVVLHRGPIRQKNLPPGSWNGSLYSVTTKFHPSIATSFSSTRKPMQLVANPRWNSEGFSSRFKDVMYFILFYFLQVSGYSLVIQARDSGTPPLSASVTVNVDISDVNDNSPVFTPANYTAVIQVSLVLNIRKKISRPNLML